MLDETVHFWEGGTSLAAKSQPFNANSHQSKITTLPSRCFPTNFLRRSASRKKKLADDYIILTNHTITGNSELQIKHAFQSVGVGRCRVFHRDWIVARIQESARLRMMVPRLYGLVDLASILDERAYKQAQLILREMGANLQKLVVTEAHRRSVRAISQHNFVLLLGSPASGKSTIGASLALGRTSFLEIRQRVGFAGVMGLFPVKM
jgi:hypothetical protein